MKPMNEELEEIVNDLLKKQDRIIPIIGENCFIGQIESDEGNRYVSLQEYIVERLIGDYVSPILKKKAYDGYYGMSLLYDLYNSIERTTQSVFRKKIKTTIKEGLQNKKIQLRKDVKEFLYAGKFDVIVTTNAFNILEYELSEMNETYHLQAFVPIAPTKESKAEEKLKLPSIYQIFGSCEGAFVLSENDLLRFLHFLNIPGYENGYGANSLVKYMKDKSLDGQGNCILMPIGCDNLPNWLFRFLWYPLSPDLLLGPNPDYYGGIWYKYSSDNDFKRFLSDYNFQTLTEPLDDVESGTDSFLLELSARLKEQTAELKKLLKDDMEVQWQEDQWDIFISYAREDRELANKIYGILTNDDFKKKVWMDNRRIRLGDMYWKAIQYGIEHSKRCMFVITDNYLNKARRRKIHDENGIEHESGVFEEIKRLEQHFLSQKKDIDSINGYSIPIILKGTKVKITNIQTNVQETLELEGGLLEKLHTYDEYAALRTDALFNKTQSTLIDEYNIGEALIDLKN